MGWTKELRAAGRAIAAWHRGAARTADLADLRSAVRNMLSNFKSTVGEIAKSVAGGDVDARLEFGTSD